MDCPLSRYDFGLADVSAEAAGASRQVLQRASCYSWFDTCKRPAGAALNAGASKQCKEGMSGLTCEDSLGLSPSGAIDSGGSA